MCSGCDNYRLPLPLKLCVCVLVQAVPVITGLAVSGLLPYPLRKRCASVLKRIAADDGLAHSRFNAVGVAQSVLLLQPNAGE